MAPSRFSIFDKMIDILTLSLYFANSSASKSRPLEFSSEHPHHVILSIDFCLFIYFPDFSNSPILAPYFRIEEQFRKEKGGGEINMVAGSCGGFLE